MQPPTHVHLCTVWDVDRSSMSLEYDYEQNRVFVNGERMLRGENERCP